MAASSSPFPEFAKKKLSAFAELFSTVQQMKPNLNQKCLLP